MTKLVTAAEMKALDEYTIKNMGVPSMVLMERAALASVEEFLRGGSEPGPWFFDEKKVLCICGAGNNGGDGFAVARLLHMKGIDVSILFVGRKTSLSKETAQQFRIAENYGIPIHENKFDIMRKHKYTALIDGIFGIGLARNVQGSYKSLIKEMNEIKKSGSVRILSLDIPSGLSADTGEVMGVAVKADKTVTFAFGKIGMTKGQGPEYAGEIAVKDIGIYLPASN